jgi:hypothetical protein
MKITELLKLLSARDGVDYYFRIFAEGHGSIRHDENDSLTGWQDKESMNSKLTSLWKEFNKDNATWEI